MQPSLRLPEKLRKKKKKKKYSLSLKEARLMHPLHGAIKHSTRESYRPNLLLLLHPIWR